MFQNQEGGQSTTKAQEILQDKAESHGEKPQKESIAMRDYWDDM